MQSRVLKDSDEAMLGEAASTLQSGNVIAFPCDTIYGFLGIDPLAEEKLFELKGRDQKSPFLALISSLEQISTEVDTSSPAAQALTALWPAPLTIIFPYKNNKSVGKGYRFPDHKLLRALISQVKTPLFSTSINMHGAPSLFSFEQVFEEYNGKIPLFVQSSLAPKTTASTIVSLLGAKPVVLREGAFSVPASVLEKTT